MTNMKNMLAKHLLTMLAMIVAVMLTAQPTHAVVTTLDGVVLSPAVGSPTDLDADVIGISVSSADFLVTTTAVATGTSGIGYTYAANGTDPGSAQAAKTGARITDGALNTSDGDDIDFGRAILAKELIFIIELEGGQDGTSTQSNIEVVLNDSAGNTISDPLSIVTADWATSLLDLATIRTDTDPDSALAAELFGVAFQLSDFTNITGIAFGIGISESGGTSSGRLDPHVFGLATPPVPEPATAALGLMGIACLIKRRRKVA